MVLKDLFKGGKSANGAPKLDLSVLAQRREAAWRFLGDAREDVVSRLVPGAVPWPNSMLGKMRIIRRAHDVLLVTDGLSDPYDPDLHPKPPQVPLDFELCIPVTESDPAAASDEALATSIWPKLLYALSDMLVEEWLDVRGMLVKFGAITVQAVIGRGFGEGFEKDGLVSFLIGMPLDGVDLNRQLYLNDFYKGLPVPYANGAVGIFPVKVLRPGELAHAVAGGNEGALALALELLARDGGCRNDVNVRALY